MESTKIRVPDEVLSGLEAVRLSGKTNMLDVPKVIELAFEMGHVDAAFWVYENRGIYSLGIFRGFAAAASPNNRNQSRHVARHGASERKVEETHQHNISNGTCERGDF